VVCHSEARTSLDMRLLAVSEQTAGSEMPESMAVDLSDPLGWLVGDGPGQCSRVRHPALGVPELPGA